MLLHLDVMLLAAVLGCRQNTRGNLPVIIEGLDFAIKSGLQVYANCDLMNNDQNDHNKKLMGC